jgi:hypothetical protein
LYQHALRDVIGRCLYGVDINPMAAELCRVSLWLEALEPGKPLSFLDHHVRVGNSLIGATPELIAAGLPDEAFTAIEGDDKKACAVLKKRNKDERKGIGPLFADQDAETQARLQQGAAALELLPDGRPGDVRAKELAFRSQEQAEEYRQKKRLADAWCAAFVIEKRFSDPGRNSSASGITQGHLNELAAGRSLLPDLACEMDRLSAHYQFFHWHLAFPEMCMKGGFDCVLGNPPWERVKLQEKEWFAERSPAIANAPNAAARKRMIDVLKVSDPALFQRLLDDSRKADGESHVMRNSGRYPLCGRGDINVYTVFAEGMRTLLNERGRTGCVLPTGIATDDTTKFFFQDVVHRRSLASLFSFENEEFVFPRVHHATRFCLLTVGGGTRPLPNSAEFVFFARQVDDLRDAWRRFTLTAEEIALLNSNTRTCPIFRSSRDAELTKAIYRRVQVLIREEQDGRPEDNPWGITFGTMFHMANDSHLFRTREQLEADEWRLEGNIFRKDRAEYLPLYEAKMIHHFDHRWGTYEGQTEAQANQGKLPELDACMHADPCLTPGPRYWVRGADVESVLGTTWPRSWLLGWRDITGTEKLRTVIAAVLPRVAVGHKLPLAFSDPEPLLVGGLYANLCSLVLDYTARQKVGGTSLTYFLLKQFPVLGPRVYASRTPWHHETSLRNWILPRVLELTYTAWDLESFAHDVGYDGPPFRWDDARRFLLRCELDAAFFHLYLTATDDGQWKPARIADGAVRDESAEDLHELIRHFPTPRDAVAYIMGTFPIVCRRDEEKYGGDYRTKRVILEIYDALQDSIRTGHPYQTRLDPPPADPRCCHPQKEQTQH